LLVSVVAPLVAGERPDKLPAELDVVPQDGKAYLVSVRLAEVWQSKAAAVFREKGAQANLVAVLSAGSLREMVGLKVEEVERLTFYTGKLEQVLVVTARRPLERDRLLKELLGTAETQHKRLGKPLLASKDIRRGMYFVNERTFLLSSPVALEDFLQDRENQQGKGKGFLTPALQAAARHQLVCFVLPSGEGQDRAPSPLDKLGTPCSLLLAANFKADVDLRLRLTYADEAAARKAARAAQDILRQLARDLPDFRDNLGDLIPTEAGAWPQGEPPQTRQSCLQALAFFKTLEKALAKVEVRRTDKEVETSLRLASLRGAIETFTILPMFFPRERRGGWQQPADAPGHRSAPAAPLETALSPLPGRLQARPR
jgi:hypothetical protein